MRRWRNQDLLFVVTRRQNVPLQTFPYKVPYNIELFFFAQIISETERDIFFLNFLEIFLRHFFLRLRDNFCRQRGGALHCFPSSITTTDTKENTHPDCETYRRGCFKIKNIYIYLEWLIRTWTEVRLLEKRKTFFSNVFQKKKRREKMFVYKYASVKRLDNFRQFYI